MSHYCGFAGCMNPEHRKEERMSNEVMRIGDADRERYVRHLNEMFAQGYLDESEREDRIHRVLESRTSGDLQHAVISLPPIKVEKPRDYEKLLPLVIPVPVVSFTGMLIMTILNQAHPTGVFDTPWNQILVCLGIVGMVASIVGFIVTLVLVGIRLDWWEG